MPLLEESFLFVKNIVDELFDGARLLLELVLVQLVLSVFVPLDHQACKSQCGSYRTHPCAKGSCSVDEFLEVVGQLGANIGCCSKL